MKKVIQSFWLLILFTSLSALAQRTITGTVTNSKDGDGLASASVQIVGSTIGTRADNEGSFSLNIPSQYSKGDFQLKISQIGYKSQVVTVKSSTEKIAVKLVEDKLNLDEVVVTALQIKREKRSLGYASTTVSNNELTNASPTSTLTGLQGKVAGANISNSGGTPGSSTRVVLRGPKSFTGNNQALIVIDGVPVNNSSFQSSDNLNSSADFGNRLNDLNPNDIESLTVLKGAEGAVLYGALAVNGVIIITTKSGKKSGKKGKDLSITLNSNFKASEVLMLPELQTQFGQGVDGFYDSRENFSWGKAFDGTYRPWGNPVTTTISSNGLTASFQSQRVKPFSAIKDNIRSAFNVGTTFTNDISLSKSFDKVDFYTSFQNTTQNGVVPNTGLDKNTARLNLGINPLDNLNFQINTAYTSSKIRNSIQGQSDNSFYDNLLQQPVDIPISELQDLNNPFNSIKNYYGAYTLNPYQVIAYNNASSKLDRFNVSGTVTYSPFKWLQIQNRLGLDNYTDSRFFKENKFLWDNVNTTPKTIIGNYSEATYKYNLLNNDLILSTSKQINQETNVTFTGGFNIFDETLESISGATAGLVIPDYFNFSNSDGRPSLSNSKSRKLKYGLYGEANVSWKNALFVTINARQDWSSSLPANKRSYFYPGISSSFVFTELMKEKDPFLTFGKLRASLTQVGSDAPAYSLNTVYASSSIGDGYNNSFVKSPYIAADGSTQVPAFTQSNFKGNPNLKPEIVTSWEVGAELGFLENRVGLDLSVYKSTTTDGIFTVTTSAATGFTSTIVNAGKMTNFGYEIAFRAVPLMTRKARLELFWNFSQNENKVESVYPGVDKFSLGGLSGAAPYVSTGDPYGTFFANGYKRDPNGRIVVDGTTGLPLASGQLTKIGTYMPKYNMSFGAKFTFNKSLSCNVLFDYKHGGYFYSRTKSITEFVGSSVTTVVNNREDYVIPNTVIQNTDGTYTENTSVAASVQDWKTNQTISEEYMLDATFFKFREFSINYNLAIKSGSLSKYIKSIDLGVFGNNLFLIVPSSNKFVDPEINSFGTGNVQGIDFSNIPSVRTFGANLRVNF